MFYSVLFQDNGKMYIEICSIKALSFGSNDFTKELKTVECTIEYRKNSKNWDT